MLPIETPQTGILASSNNPNKASTLPIESACTHIPLLLGTKLNLAVISVLVTIAALVLALLSALLLLMEFNIFCLICSISAEALSEVDDTTYNEVPGNIFSIPFATSLHPIAPCTSLQNL